jgi:hypothetical protein
VGNRVILRETAADPDRLLDGIEALLPALGFAEANRQVVERYCLGRSASAAAQL